MASPVVVDLQLLDRGSRTRLGAVATCCLALLVSSAEINPSVAAESARLRVRIVGVDKADASRHSLPARMTVQDSDGKYLDGAGRGLYADGRFFVDGSFEFDVPPGSVTLRAESGPEYIPTQKAIDVRGGSPVAVELVLRRWFSMASRGWIAGDHHVHAQHDARAAVRTDLAYAALQARANGLQVVTEAGSNVDYSPLRSLSTPEFLLHRGDEIRPGAFVGHFNTPGLSEPLPWSVRDALGKTPLPGHRLRDEVHRRGGALIHTHPMTPPHLIHWMGAGEFLSDAVLGKCADAFDIDSVATMRLWHAGLALGNRIAASSYTDCALGRVRTLSPGDRRVYCRAESLTPSAVAHAIRQGRTIATNGGPLFLFLDVAGRGPGDTIQVSDSRTLAVTLRVAHLRPLRSV